MDPELWPCNLLEAADTLEIVFSLILQPDCPLEPPSLLLKTMLVLVPYPRPINFLELASWKLPCFSDKQNEECSFLSLHQVPEQVVAERPALAAGQRAPTRKRFGQVSHLSFMSHPQPFPRPNSRWKWQFSISLWPFFVSTLTKQQLRL